MRPPPSRSKRYRCVLCSTKTVTKTEMAAHLAEFHSFLKLEAPEDSVAPTKKLAKKKTAPASEKKPPVKRLKRKSEPKEKDEPARKKRVELPENTAAGEIFMRNCIESRPYAAISPMWQCLACGKQFADTMDLHDHVQSKHVESETNQDGLKLRILGYCCEVCGHCFDELEYMIGHHLAAHADVKPPTFDTVTRSTEWALLCFTCLQYYRRTGKWFTNHWCINWVDTDALEKTKSKLDVEPSFLCDVCAATFRFKCAYQYHRAVRHKGVTEIEWDALEPTVVPFLCQKCDKGFMEAADSQAHVCDKTAEEIVQLPLQKSKVPCPQCNAMLANAKIMRRHVKTVHEKLLPKEPTGNERKYRPEGPTIRCPFCELKFMTAKDMLAHSKDVHNQELRNPYFCAKCVKEFNSNSKLKQHYEVYHTGPEDKETVQAVCKLAERTKDDTVFYMCPQCARKFLNPMDYFRHHQWHQIKREFTCDRCGYSAPTREALTFHMRSVHHENRTCRYPCDMCSSVLSSKFSLREHLAATHGTERPYVCERCGKDFPTKVRLQSHIRTHLFGSQLSISEKRYGCDLCGKEFKKKQTLRDHLAVHTGVRNEPCSVCGKLFFTKLSAYCHKVQAHSTVRPYKCTICEATFPLRSFLTRHLKKHAEKEARKKHLLTDKSLWLTAAEKDAIEEEEIELGNEATSSPDEQKYLHE